MKRPRPTPAALALLVDAFERADRKSGGRLLRDVDEKAVRDGAVRLWMRLVFRCAAEARGLWVAPPGHDPLGECVGRGDTGGGRSGATRLPFLEALAAALDDGAVRRLLAAARSLGPLEVEEIGRRYEDLIGREIRRAVAPVLALAGRGGARPHVALDELEDLRDAGRDALLGHLARLTGRGRRALARALAAPAAPDAPRLERLADGDLAERVAPWAGLLRDSEDGTPAVVPPGGLYLAESRARRTSGAHYTPRSLTEPLVREALAPLVSRCTARELLELRVADLALGSGAFLVQVCRELSERVLDAWRVEAEATRRLPADPDERRRLARRLVAERCLHGVDLDPMAVEVARVCLWLTVGDPAVPPTFLDRALRVGDSLLADDEPTFDAVVGNPPWMAHAKRAAVPLVDARRAELRRRYPGFSAYPTTHGAFLVRAARALRPGGRLALLLPTSVADLDGYAGYRAAHDELCAVDEDLRPIPEGAFEEVFQPCTLVTSTRRAAPVPGQVGAAWSLARPDLSPAAREFIRHVADLPTLPSECFGERGLTSNAANRAHILRADEARDGVPLLAGADVKEFRVGRPSYRAQPVAWPRPAEVAARYANVALVIRQTARFPVAAVSDGTAFRNSLLAGFATADLSAHALCAWLNSTPIRWLHFMRFRDAREGMPQVKISHLRRIPAPPPATAEELHALGRRLHEDPGEEARSRLDAGALAALGAPDDVRREIEAWRDATP